MRQTSSWFGMVLASLTCGVLVGCSGADDPKMVVAPPPTGTPDTSVPKVVGPAKQPYGTNKKYQEYMNKN